MEHRKEQETKNFAKLQGSLLFWKGIIDYLVTRSQQKVLDSL